MAYNIGENDVKTPSDCIDVAIVDAYDDEQIYCWIECLGNVFYGVDYVYLSGKKVCFLGFENIDDKNLVAIYKSYDNEEKISLNAIEFIKPSKIQKLWLEGYHLWKSNRS